MTSAVGDMYSMELHNDPVDASATGLTVGSHVLQNSALARQLQTDHLIRKCHDVRARGAHLPCLLGMRNK